MRKICQQWGALVSLISGMWGSSQTPGHTQTRTLIHLRSHSDLRAILNFASTNGTRMKIPQFSSSTDTHTARPGQLICTTGYFILGGGYSPRDHVAFIF
uniref:Putative secreted protein n=1 Tax=Lutzomyia longipalpis TaxID=7200 RepID=A0A7G3APJ9_LUTLO